MNQYFETLGVSSGPKEELEAVAQRESVEVRQVEMSRVITPLKDLKSVWELYQLFKKEQPAIVHTHTPKAGIVGMLAANLAGVPLRLHTVAGMPLMEATGIKRKILDAVEKLTYAFATRVYPISYSLKDFIIDSGYSHSKKIKILANGSSNGVDTDFFNLDQVSEEKKKALKAELKIEASDFVFVFVGRLVGDKGINELVKAFSVINNQSLVTSCESIATKNQSPATNHKLLLVGPYEHELDPLQKETLEAIDQNPNIISVGFKEDVRQYFAIADALVFPSYREGFGAVVAQAGAMGLPAIVTNINGCNEIIEEGKNGLIVPPKDTKALQQAMVKIVDDPNLYQHLKSNARPMITSRYEQNVVWEALLEEYKSLLKMNGLDLEKDAENRS